MPGCGQPAKPLLYSSKFASFMTISSERGKCLAVRGNMVQGQHFEGILLFGKSASRGKSCMKQTAARIGILN